MLKNKENEGINKIECETIGNTAIYEHIINLLLEINNNSFSIHKNKAKFIKDKRLLENAKRHVINSPVNKTNNELPAEVAKLLLEINEFSFANPIMKGDEVYIDKNEGPIAPVLNPSDLKKELPAEIMDILLKFSKKTEASASPEVTDEVQVTPVVQEEPEPQIPVNISNTREYTREEMKSVCSHFYIYEVGIFMGIIVGKTTRDKVIDIMKINTGIDFDKSSNDPIINFSDISVNIYFDENNVVTELEFGENFKGTTRKGLRIGDTVEKAIEIYGEPTMKTPKGATWDKVKIFYNEDIISKIKLG